MSQHYLSESRIRSWLNKSNNNIGQYTFDIRKSASSTIDQIKTYPLPQTSSQSQVCLLEEQTAGRGRLGRVWHSPAAVNLYCSTAWWFSQTADTLAALSLVTALAILAALKQYGIEDNLSIKWPNDVLYEGKKLAGILLQCHPSQAKGTQIIASFGLNVNSDPMQPEASIEQAWTSIKAIQAKEHDRNHIIALILNQLYQYYAKFREKGWDAFIPEWTRYDDLHGKRVTLYTIGQETSASGTVLGVDRVGRLLLQDEQDHVHAYASGEVSLKNPTL